MIPTDQSKPKGNLLDYTIMIHGFPKIGKSTLANQAGKVLFADAEGGLSALKVYKSPVISWTNGEGSFLQLCKEFTTEKHDYIALCIDTIDMIHQHCTKYMMGKQEVIHPSDLDWGKGWALVKDEFIRPLAKLAVSPYGLILISHSREVEITTRISKYTKAVPTLQSYIWTQIQAFVDIIIYFNSEVTEDGEKRFLRTKPSEKWIAGDRTNKLLKADPIQVEPEVDNWKKLEEAFQQTKKIETKPERQGILLGGD